jgi:co-chaperonin GroES (HSP10)
MMWECEDGRRFFEGAIPEGVLPKGTLVICMNGWEVMSRREDFTVKTHLKEQYPGFIHSMVQPMAIMAYCNESTGWQWHGYAGWVMLEIGADSTSVNAKLELEESPGSKQQLRRVCGVGYNLESGRKLRHGELVVVSERQGAPTKINASFAQTKVKEGYVTFVTGAQIYATAKQNIMKKYSIKPEGSMVLIRPDEPEIWLSDQIKFEMVDDQKRRPERGSIIEFGPDVPERFKKKGTIVLYPERNGTQLNTSNEKDVMIIMHTASIFAILEETSEDEEGYNL